MTKLPSGGKFPPADPQWLYKVRFDPSVCLESTLVDAQTLDYLNSFRENIFVNQDFSVVSTGQPDAAPTATS